MKKSTEYFYKEFKNRVLQGRDNLESETLDDLALGRVWSGNTALENGLIDEIGGFNKTIEIAKSMAGLEDADIEIVEYPNNNNNGLNIKNKQESHYNSQLLLDLMPENLKQELNDQSYDHQLVRDKKSLTLQIKYLLKPIL